MPEPPHEPAPLTPLFAAHPRHWRDNLYVYPVISRRSRGLSVGVNLNPDKACNFDCIYCQVDRTAPPAVRQVDLDRLRAELDDMLDIALTHRLFAEPPFCDVPESHRRLRDIAFSGDGEPTACPLFPEAVDLAVDLYRTRGLKDVKLRLITDAAYLTRPRVCRALARMHDCGGEIWAKLDAGTEPYYRLVNRPNVSLNTVLANILDAALCFRVIIQSLWMNVRGQPPPPEEIDAFAGRLADVLAAGGRILLVQVYTVARRPAEPFVTPLNHNQLARIADRVRARVSLPVEVFDA